MHAWFRQCLKRLTLISKKIVADPTNKALLRSLHRELEALNGKLVGFRNQGESAASINELLEVVNDATVILAEVPNIASDYRFHELTAFAFDCRLNALANLGAEELPYANDTAEDIATQIMTALDHQHLSLNDYIKILFDYNRIRDKHNQYFQFLLTAINGAEDKQALFFHAMQKRAEWICKNNLEEDIDASFAESMMQDIRDYHQKKMMSIEQIVDLLNYPVIGRESYNISEYLLLEFLQDGFADGVMQAFIDMTVNVIKAGKAAWQPFFQLVKTLLDKHPSLVYRALDILVERLDSLDHDDWSTYLTMLDALIQEKATRHLTSARFESIVQLLHKGISTPQLDAKRRFNCFECLKHLFDKVPSRTLTLPQIIKLLTPLADAFKDETFKKKSIFVELTMQLLSKVSEKADVLLHEAFIGDKKTIFQLLIEILPTVLLMPSMLKMKMVDGLYHTKLGKYPLMALLSQEMDSEVLCQLFKESVLEPKRLFKNSPRGLEKQLKQTVQSHIEAQSEPVQLLLVECVLADLPNGLQDLIIPSRNYGIYNPRKSALTKWKEREKQLRHELVPDIGDSYADIHHALPDGFDAPPSETSLLLADVELEQVSGATWRSQPLASDEYHHNETEHDLTAFAP